MKSGAERGGVSFPRLPQGFVPWMKAMEKIVEKLCRLSKLQVSVDGGTAGSTDSDGSGVHLRVAGSGTVVEPDTIALKLWLVKHAPGQFYVTYGEVDGQAVRVGSTSGAELDNDDPWIFSLSTARVWLAIQFDMTFEQGWFVGAELVGAYVDTGSTVPSNNPTGGSFYVPLARVVSGVITQNSMGYNLYTLLRDNSSISTANVAFALGRVS